MEELRITVSKNLCELRKRSGLTQAELAEKINYSDKAVSKWERGDGVPDVSVLMQLSQIFGVNLDWFVQDVHPTQPTMPPSRKAKKDRAIITSLSVCLVWLIATMIFVIFGISQGSVDRYWLVYLYAVPLTFVVLLVFNCIWGNTRWNYMLVSCLVWSVLFCLYISLFLFLSRPYIWLLFILGVPAQTIIFLWSGLGSK